LDEGFFLLVNRKPIQRKVHPMVINILFLLIIAERKNKIAAIKYKDGTMFLDIFIRTS
jgi:hypothetical protein